MARKDETSQAVRLEELAVSNAFEIAALIAVLERKGLLTREEVLAESAQQRKSRPRGR
jgi:hypothetical protein